MKNSVIDEKKVNSKKRNRDSFERRTERHEHPGNLSKDNFTRNIKQKKDYQECQDEVGISKDTTDLEQETDTHSSSFFAPQFSSSTNTCDVSTSLSQDIKLSKRAQKRLSKKEALKETKQIRRRAEKEKRKLNKQKRQEKVNKEQTEGNLSLNIDKNNSTSTTVLFTAEERARLREENKIMKEQQLREWLSRCDANCGIVIDCSYQDKLTEKELISLKQQIMYSYSANKKVEEPSRIYITSCNGRLAEEMSTICGHDTWPGISFHEDNYLKFFQKEDIVYLTSDSPHEIDELDPNCNYIIGGIVDHGRLKNLTYEDAIANKIRTARFPLTKYVKLEASSVLTVNHVVDIILALQRFNGDWLKALNTCLPNRKKWKFLHDQNQEPSPGNESKLISNEDKKEKKDGREGLEMDKDDSRISKTLTEKEENETSIET